MDIFEHNPLGDIRIDLSGGLVRGPVFIRGVVIAKETLTLDSEWIDTEFPIQAKEIQPGDLIAFTEELRFEAGLEKLAPLESIFHLKRHENVAEGVFEIYLEGESIEILVAPDLHGFLSLLRGQIMKDTLLSSLFLPVVMATLEAMRAEDAYSEKRWHSIMSARCSAESIDFKNSDIAEAAQKLLDSPLGALHKMFAREST
ncbi:hypothetical protein [Stenotrophomonas acidaminiphila]|uniref:hypothetical protein n=1 Tax=Stenotrophomonas acidaminiphila TaxID=128780 RepID=UPI001FAEEA84|nr:hypothetical protein [Stenotrophomonas acidaminiphila]